MKLEYTGPKEIISAHGIDFKSGKDDKYIYIYPALQIYEAIHHEYEKGILYHHQIEKKRLNDDELLNKIISINPNVQNNIEEELAQLDRFLENEIEDVNSHKEYTDEERKIYKNNLILMKKYKRQRGINKIVYNQLIEIIVNDIILKQLKVISSPFNERFWHILQTIQGELSNHHKRSIGSKIQMNHEGEKLNISLNMNSIGK